MSDCNHGKEGCDTLIILRRRFEVSDSSIRRNSNDIIDMWKAINFIRNLLIIYGGATVVATAAIQLFFKFIS